MPIVLCVPNISIIVYCNPHRLSMKSLVVISLPSVTVRSARIDLISPLFRLAINSYTLAAA
jgi:hypothetical protein